MLDIRIVSGRGDTALVRPQTVALSETMASKYFGDENPIGETVKIDIRPYEVTAVFEDVAQHSHLRPQYLLSFATTGWASRFEDNWQRQQIFTYLKLAPGADAKALEAKFPAFVERYAKKVFEEKNFTYVPYLQNIRDIHLHSSNFEWEVAERGNTQSVYILSAAAVMILLISSLNFINLSTARATKRMKEVGVRKVSGASRQQLMVQFMAESVFLTMAGLLVAIILCELLMPVANLTLDKRLYLPYEPTFIVGALAFCIVLGVLAGSYPSFLLSGFRPHKVLSRAGDTRSGAGFFRQSLVVLQFMLSFFLITASWIILSQNNLLMDKNLGFDKDQVVVVPLTSAQLRDQETTKQHYINHPGVVSATIGFGLPGDISAGDGVIDPATGQELATTLYCVDYDYIKTMGMRLRAGRDFSIASATDSSEAFILSETTAKLFGYGTPDEAVGKRLDWERWDSRELKKGTIIGVVEDFHFKSLREKLSPVVLQIFPGASWKMAVRIKSENREETIAHLKKTYESLEQERIFTYSFLDENYDAMYKSEQRLSKLFTAFTYLAMLVACLGLYGLVEYSVSQRTREIGIRKVFGASLSSLLLLLTRRYFLLQMIACAAIIPISYYFANEWLSSFAYRVDITIGMFLKAVLVILTITAITVSFQSMKAALSNPAKVLRNE
jgi:putative ABC transport system permease protein